MRVLFVTPYLPARDGIADYTAALVRSAVERGDEIAVVAAAPSRTAPGEVIGVLHATSPRQAVFTANAVLAWAPDVVHVQFAVAAFAGRLPALLRLLHRLDRAGLPIVVTMHEVTRDVRLLRGPGRQLYRHLAALANRIIVHTDEAAEALTALGVRPDTVTVVPHHQAGLPAPVATPEDLREQHGLGTADVVLAFGFIHVDKGLDDLVRALGIVTRRQRRTAADICLVVAGEVRRRQGPFRVFEVRDRWHLHQVRRMLRRTGLHRYVVFAGYVPDGDVAAWMSAAKVLALPYRRAEQSGVASLAAAAGTRMVVSDAGGLPSFEGARTFPSGDVEALAAALEAELATGDSTPTPVAAVDLRSTMETTALIYRGARTEAANSA